MERCRVGRSNSVAEDVHTLCVKSSILIFNRLRTDIVSVGMHSDHMINMGEVLAGDGVTG